MSEVRTHHTARQGGDLRELREDWHYVDMGTCVNAYGPPPEVRRAVEDLDLAALRPHPYGAAERFQSLYADYLEVDPALLTVGRGISEFIRALAMLFGDRTAVITPDYTDTIASFPVHLGPPPGTLLETPELRLRRLLEGMGRYRFVMLSNPNNPTGIYIDSEHLIAACEANPDCVLIADEAFIDFIAPEERRSMVHADLENLIVLRSPNKLFGIAGIRTGALFTRNERLRAEIRKVGLNWPLSYVDVHLACAAVEARDWAERTRRQLLATAAEMEALMAERFPATLAGVPVHYRFVPTPDPDAAYRHLLGHGVVVRTFSASQRGRIPGIRITAPTKSDFDGITAAFA